MCWGLSGALTIPYFGAIKASSSAVCPRGSNSSFLRNYVILHWQYCFHNTSSLLFNIYQHNHLKATIMLFLSNFYLPRLLVPNRFWQMILERPAHVYSTKNLHALSLATSTHAMSMTSCFRLLDVVHIQDSSTCLNLSSYLLCLVSTPVTMSPSPLLLKGSLLYSLFRECPSFHHHGYKVTTSFLFVGLTGLHSLCRRDVQYLLFFRWLFYVSIRYHNRSGWKCFSKQHIYGCQYNKRPC